MLLSPSPCRQFFRFAGLLAVFCSMHFQGMAQLDSTHTDTVQRSKGKFFPSPVLGYSPETRLYFGAGLVWYLPPSKKYPNSNASVIKAVGVYTLNKQIESNISGESYFGDNLYKLNYTTNFFKFPDAFYGIGNQNSPDDKESYNYDYFNLQVNGERLVFPKFFAGLKTFIETTKVYDVKEGGIFDTEDVPGEDGGLNTGIGPWLTYDTRDNIYFPLKGLNADFSAVFHSKLTGSNYTYVDYMFEFSQFNKMMRDDVLGFNVYAQFVPGEAPFNRLAQLGGDRHMRGHYEGRYRDINYIAVQAEYRITFWKYFGVNIFAGTGEVAPDLNSFSLGGLHYSYGVGGRLFIVPEDKLSLRVDYGFDEEGNGSLYVTFREAF